MTDIQEQLLSESELEFLKQISKVWLQTYCSIPPTQLLAIYLIFYRFAQQIIQRQQAVASVTIAQANTVVDLHAAMERNMMQSRWRA